MTLSQKPRWPLILSMKSASERRCRRRKSGGQTRRGKQHIANAACFDLSTQASQIMPSNSAFITLRMFIKHQLYARHYAMKWKGHAWPRGSHPSMCVCVCVCVCSWLCVHRECLHCPVSGLLHGIFDLMDACSLCCVGSCILGLFPFPPRVFLIMYSCLFLICSVSKQTKLLFL